MKHADLQEHSVMVDGYRMAAWRAVSPAEPGRMPPVVCVHGAGISSRPLMPLVEELGERVETWTVDLPGFGRSAKPPHRLGFARTR